MVAPIDLGALRHERAVRRGHQNLGHLRTECFLMYRQSFYPPGRGEDRGKLSIEGNDEAIEEVKGRMGYR